MYKRQIIQAIAERLMVTGNCPADSCCPFAGADGCTAPADTLKERLAEAEGKLRETEEGLVIRNTLNPSPWPCNDLIAIVFVDKKGTDNTGGGIA